MIPEDFTSEVYSRWPYRNQRDEGELEAIRADLYTFASRQNPSLLDSILNEFRGMKPPKGFGMWWFYQQGESSGKSGIWWRICDCGQQYKDRGTSCPVCGSTYFKLCNGDVMPTETMMIQASCSQCNWFKDNLTNPVFGLYGSSCNEYGTDERGKQKGYCERCKCRGCCDMAYLYKNNPNEYRNQYGDIVDKKFKEVMEMLTNGKDERKIKEV